MPSIICRAAAGVLLALSALPVAARPVPAELASALAAVIWDGVPPPEATRVLTDDLQAEYVRLDAAVARGEPDYMDVVLSAAILARTAAHPATRGAMYDLARQLLHHAVEDPARSGAVQLWQAVDPFIHTLQLGVGFAQSDLAAAVALEQAGGAPDSDTPARLTLAWTENADSPPNQHFLTRLNAWGAGTMSAWPTMDETARAEASGVTWRDDIPSVRTVHAVTGSDDLFGWLSAITLSVTPVERAAHPALSALLADGSLAGGMARMPPGTSSAAWADSSSFLMMFRLNNYIIGGGDISDWQAGSAMWNWQ